jgi:hypothetical protein
MSLRTQKVELKSKPFKLCDFKNNYKVIVKADPKNKKPVLVGGSDVTSDNGFPIFPGETLPLPNVDYDKIYVVGQEGEILYLLVWSS